MKYGWALLILTGLANEPSVRERFIWGLCDLGWPQLGRSTVVLRISHSLPVVQPANTSMMVAEMQEIGSKNVSEVSVCILSHNKTGWIS